MKVLIFSSSLCLLQEFFQRQRNAVERNGVTVKRHQNQQTSTKVSQDLIALHATKHSVQSHQGILYIYVIMCQGLPFAPIWKANGHNCGYKK